MKSEEEIKKQLKELKEKDINKYNAAFFTLIGDERMIVQLRFGLVDGIEYSFDEISKEIMPKRPIMGWRVRQIFEKALRKLDI